MRFFILLLLMTSAAFAQDSTIAYNHRYALKFDLGALIDPDRTVQIGLEFPIGTRTSWQTVVGYGWRGLQSDELKAYREAEVWRIRNEVRFYTGRFRTNVSRNIAIKATTPLGNYWGFELLTKQVNGADKTYRYYLNTGCSPGPCTDFENRLISTQRYVVGTHLKVGRQFAIPYTKETLSRVLIDVYMGAGIRYAIVQEQGRDRSSEEPLYLHPGMFRDRFDPGNRFVPSFVGGVKMGLGL